MCGFVGISSKISINNQILKESVEKISYRGPDHTGIWISSNNKIGFAHKRLSILDLSKNGNQPMSSLDGKLQIIYNGEIYNYKKIKSNLLGLGYKFFSNTDTEVILNSYKAWGNECFKKFNGMFSLAIYDLVNSKIILARDRCGQKPLYYFQDHNTFAFASELKCLFHLKNKSLKLNQKSLDFYLSNGYISGQDCLVKDFFKLEAGHYLEISLNNHKYNINPYWNIPNKLEHFNYNKEEYLDKIINESVKSQLIADVPVGVMLSGGLDSSLVASVASRHQNNIKTFSVIFDGDKGLDKSQSKLVSKFIGSDHTEIFVNDINPEMFFQITDQLDEPLNDSSILPSYLISKEIKKNIKVVLGGDGADELFGGYKHYNKFLFIKNFKKILPNIKISILKKLIPFYSKYYNWLSVFNLNLNDPKCLPLIAKYFPKEIKNKFIKKINEIDYNSSFDLNKKYIKEDLDLVSRALKFDFSNYLVEDILVKIDRSSMLNSLEVRSPYLDNDIIDFSFKNLNINDKLSYFKNKIILKKIASKYLPKQFLFNRKQGFSIPQEKLFISGKFKEMSYDILCSDNSNFKKLSEKLFNVYKKEKRVASKIFTILILELWLKKNKINL